MLETEVEEAPFSALNVVDGFVHGVGLEQSIELVFADSSVARGQEVVQLLEAVAFGHQIEVGHGDRVLAGHRAETGAREAALAHQAGDPRVLLLQLARVEETALVRVPDRQLLLVSL